MAGIGWDDDVRNHFELAVFRTGGMPLDVRFRRITDMGDASVADPVSVGTLVLADGVAHASPALDALGEHAHAGARVDAFIMVLDDRRCPVRGWHLTDVLVTGWATQTDTDGLRTRVDRAELSYSSIESLPFGA
ncbi:hypothetical protein [Streptomyces sp. SID3343]|uniref:hypothetical protein n=1 Tax=Streptomyces sp. SID3343 TaxID=2690260 RepID=UPI0013721C4E|nr:hypothetical protein [Streptomyces sp. SID3343]MYV97561.1 hypothetical protein [Streptomyces sp. SID3343]